MGDLDEVTVGAEQSRGHEALDDPAASIVAVDGAPWHPMAHRVPVLPEAHEPGHQLTEHGLVGLVEVPEHAFRALADRLANPSRLTVPGQCQGAPLAAPSQRQHVGQQREPPGLAEHVVDSRSTSPSSSRSPAWSAGPSMA